MLIQTMAIRQLSEACRELARLPFIFRGFDTYWNTYAMMMMTITDSMNMNHLVQLFVLVATTVSSCVMAGDEKPRNKHVCPFLSMIHPLSFQLRLKSICSGNLFTSKVVECPLDAGVSLIASNRPRRQLARANLSGMQTWCGAACLVSTSQALTTQVHLMAT